MSSLIEAGFVYVCIILCCIIYIYIVHIHIIYDTYLYIYTYIYTCIYFGVALKAWARIDPSPPTVQRCLADCLGAPRAKGAGRALRDFCEVGVLYYTILYYTILYYAILYYAILCYTILYYTILYYTILYYTKLYCTILPYYTIPYHTIIHCIITDIRFKVWLWQSVSINILVAKHTLHYLGLGVFYIPVHTYTYMRTYVYTYVCIKR